MFYVWSLSTKLIYHVNYSNIHKKLIVNSMFTFEIRLGFWNCSFHYLGHFTLLKYILSTSSLILLISVWLNIYKFTWSHWLCKPCKFTGVPFLACVTLRINRDCFDLILKYLGRWVAVCLSLFKIIFPNLMYLFTLLFAL